MYSSAIQKTLIQQYYVVINSVLFVVLVFCFVKLLSFVLSLAASSENTIKTKVSRTLQ